MEYGGSFEGFQVARGKDSRAESPAVARNDVGRVGGKMESYVRTQLLNGILVIEVVCQSGGQFSRVQHLEFWTG